ncbi:hypothetical protein GCM10027072_05460 [Streptomyces bullii]
MSRIHRAWVLLGDRSAAMDGMARNRMLSIMNRSIAGSTSTASASHSLRPADGAGAVSAEDIGSPFTGFPGQP